MSNNSIKFVENQALLLFNVGTGVINKIHLNFKLICLKNQSIANETSESSLLGTQSTLEVPFGTLIVGLHTT